MSWFSNELNPPFKLKREFTSSYWWNDENLYTLYFLKYLIKKGKRQIAWFCYSNNILAGLQARLCVCLSSACCDRYLWATAVTRVSAEIPSHAWYFCFPSCIWIPPSTSKNCVTAAAGASGWSFASFLTHLGLFFCRPTSTQLPTCDICV